MEIKDLLNSTSASPSETKTQTVKTGADFAQALREAERKRAGASPDSVEAWRSTQTAEASLVGSWLKAKSSPQAQVGRTLDALDTFAQALADPGLSLDEISPLAQNLAGEAKNLENLVQELTEDDRLKPLVMQTAVLAAVEAAKFKRGDYA
ncbi:MAG: hypothetical protein AB1641_08735 [Thermodesulfobacteriota bacterium]